jgi:ribosomal protein S18 acetylase RimI-like enzyme
MDKTITLRKAEIGDIERIKTILFRSLQEYNIPMPDNYSVADIDSIAHKNASAEVFVLDKDGYVIGFTVLKPIDEDAVELKRLYLKAAQRGRKLGDYLLAYVISYANQKQYKYIRLETTSKFKEAFSLYRKHGFIALKDVETSPGHDLVFEKRLGP